MIFISALDRTNVARPEKSLGVPYSWCTFREAAGLPEWPLESPADRTKFIPFLCADILFNIWGRLPVVLLTTPTCSGDRINNPSEIKRMLLAVAGVSQQFSFTRNKLDMVPAAVVLCEGDKEHEAVNVVGGQKDVVCLANC